MTKHHLNIFQFETTECPHAIEGFRLSDFGNSIQCGGCGEHIWKILNLDKPGAWDRWLEFHAKRPDLVIQKAE